MSMRDKRIRPRNGRLILCAIVVTSVLFTETAAAANRYYYCPKGNGTLAISDNEFMGKMNSDFPLSPEWSANQATSSSPTFEWS